MGFKQSAIIAVIPFLYLMSADGDHRYHRFLAPLFFVLAAMFGALWLWYGPAVRVLAHRPPYLHSWILMLPFMALLTCREFARRKSSDRPAAKDGS
ncbi:MAG: hypothetical protein METHP_01253 [Methanoregula sp. SKADARSKE-2]|nr:MAG: hypothetical protein METHP_01253 [Methanoregula sp. SKADARSKE-2]